MRPVGTSHNAIVRRSRRSVHLPTALQLLHFVRIQNRYIDKQESMSTNGSKPRWPAIRLRALERQVALATLNAARVRTIDFQHVDERLRCRASRQLKSRVLARAVTGELAPPLDILSDKLGCAAIAKSNGQPSKGLVDSEKST